MWKKCFSVFTLSQPFLISLTFLHLSLRRICVLQVFGSVMRVCTCVFNNMSVCFVELYCRCVPCYLQVFYCSVSLCQYLFILFILCVTAPWLEVHFSNQRSNLNLCINSFLGFERLCYGSEIRQGHPKTIFGKMSVRKTI